MTAHRSKDRSRVIAIVLLALITLLALGLRLYRLDAQSLWYDEAFSAYLAAMSPAEITARTAADIQPPLYYYLLHGWIGWMGDDEIGLRSLSLLFGLLTVPLIYAVAVELFRSRLAGLLAALLLAVSPLHIWYGQEARMYTLLTFLGLLSGYLLLLLTGRELSRGKQAALWLAYALTGIAAIYTHYFAFFLLAFQGVYLLLAWWGRGFRPRSFLLGGAAAGLTILLAYLPWLPYVLNRYRQDVSYWPGRLKLGEILVDIALFFTGGESVSEQAGVPLALGYVLIFLLCLAALVQFTIHNSQFTRRNSQFPIPNSQFTNLPIPFLLLYLLLPPTLILALSYFTPKFNARYVMIAHPALLLILAGGMAALWQRRPGSLGNVLRGALSSLMLLFLLGVSAYATRNAYTDPAFARADFRGAVRYLRKHIGPNETVILVSGHMFPAFDYYAPDLERHLLPESQTLDTTQTLDYSIAGKLNEWLAGKDGVWLVLWQDEVVDPAGFLTAMLDDLAVEEPVDRTFAQVRLKHYRLPEGAVFAARPEIAHPADINFGNKLRLLGYTQTGERQVTMFWEAIQPLTEDYRVSIVLRDPLGQSWGQWDGRPTAYYYPTDRWKPGRVVFGRYDLDLMPGSPPGD
ncbi:MAG TPA: phospholipid carrier-dependent glycosyltransferase, partial [Anaerolineae bacterium]|nr:phospholipid carrier-dependent glycosyltransferase [Anaerolineae bacterium]